MPKLKTHITTPGKVGNLSESTIECLVEQYNITPQEAPAWHTYDKEIAAWRYRVSVLVTCICMGGRHYAKEVSALPILKDARPVEKQHKNIEGKWETIKTIPCRYKNTQDERDRLEHDADLARIELGIQCGISIDKWPQIADQVMKRNDLLAWLQIQKLIPEKPKTPFRAIKETA